MVFPYSDPQYWRPWGLSLAGKKLRFNGLLSDPAGFDPSRDHLSWNISSKYIRTRLAILTSLKGSF